VGYLVAGNRFVLWINWISMVHATIGSAEAIVASSGSVVSCDHNSIADCVSTNFIRRGLRRVCHDRNTCPHSCVRAGHFESIPDSSYCCDSCYRGVWSAHHACCTRCGTNRCVLARGMRNLNHFPRFDFLAPNIKLKSFASLTRTWQPVTALACATAAPERPGRLTWCYAPWMIE